MARILVADDVAPIRELVKLAAAQDGHETTEGYDAPSTVAAYLAAEPDLLVLDLVMPGGGGKAVLEELRRAKEGRICPVLIVSGYIDQTPDAELAALGADAILAKPLTVERLRLEMQSLLSRDPEA
ncbi:MAG: response regulator [Planctomycetota bacterium]|jgi:CheY-like chemotaxis protein